MPKEPKEPRALRRSRPRSARRSWSVDLSQSTQSVLESLLTHGGSCIAVVQGPDLRYSLVSADYQAIAPGLQMLGRTYRQVFPEAADNGAEARLHQVLQTGEPWPVEAYHAPVAGKPDATWQGRVVRLPLEPGREPAALIVIWDITERMRTEQALRQSEQRFRQVVESLPQLVWTCQPDGLCDYLSPQWVRYTGVPEASQLGLGWLEQLHPEDRQPTVEHWRATAARGATFEAEFRLRRYDGAYRWFRTVAVPLRDEAGGITKWFGTNIDVTEKREAEQVLTRGKEDLEQLVAERTAKLEELVGELEHFSYTITHDMRAPLRSMRGFAELVLELCEPCPHPEQKSLLRRVITSAERMDLLITDALSYSRAVRQQLPLGPVDLGGLLRGMLDTYPEFQAAGPGIQVQQPLPRVLGNPAGLTQVFSNLLGNAIKFTKPGQPPQIHIWAEAVPYPRGEVAPDAKVPPRADAALLPAPPALIRVWVEDKGVGIAKGMLSRVFHMFARGNSRLPGTGIGLALVRKVVDRMGGRVGVLSEEGAGSRFWLELLPGEPLPSRPLPLPSPPAGPGAIL